VSGVDQSFSTWNHSSSSETVAQGTQADQPASLQRVRCEDAIA
jgi:hypothetical protein